MPDEQPQRHAHEGDRQPGRHHQQQAEAGDQLAAAAIDEATGPARAERAGDARKAEKPDLGVRE
jgi:hypothetical protein